LRLFKPFQNDLVEFFLAKLSTCLLSISDAGTSFHRETVSGNSMRLSWAVGEETSTEEYST
jgi:hypothetical protein